MAQITERRLETILKDYADSLGITEAQRENAERKYTAIGQWLDSGDFFKDYAPIIYPQGSFALGTVVRPGSGEEFDLDIIVQLTKGDILKSPKEIRQAVKDRIDENRGDNPCLGAEKTTWSMYYTLSFPKKFSMDVVPATYESEDTINRLKLRYPDKEKFLDGIIKVVNGNDDWLASNPKGYIKWFDEISKESRHLGVVKIQNELAKFPAHKVRTPLQAIVQILKKHAMVMFSDDEQKDNKPSSIAITTLAALSYKKEPTVYQALKNFKTNALRILGDGLLLQNPTNPGEYFSDAWEHDEVKKRALIKWLDRVDVFVNNLLMLDENADNLTLEELFKKEKLQSLYKNYIDSRALPDGYKHALNSDIPIKIDATKQYDIAVIPEIEYMNMGTRHAKTALDVKKWVNFNEFGLVPFPDKLWLKFTVKTDCPRPYEVLFQVVNAPDCPDPRGDVKHEISVDTGYNIFHEVTLYTGLHYVEFFIIKDGRLVAKKRIWVPIDADTPQHFRLLGS